MSDATLFQLLSRGLETTLRNLNPWWRGEPLLGLPPVRRWAFEPIQRHLREGTVPCVVLRGPRQIGKTTLLNQLIAAELAAGLAPQRLLRLQFDDLPELRKLSMPLVELLRWFEENVAGKTMNQAANDAAPFVVFLDEVQNLAEWGPQLKHLLDIGRVRAMVTGSSALRIEAGRDSLAGRVRTLEMGPLLLREIGQVRGLGTLDATLPENGLTPLKEKEVWLSLRASGQRQSELRRAVFAAFSERGAYPYAHVNPTEPWESLAEHLTETVVRRAIQHDLRLGPGQKRDESLLAEVFRLGCTYIGQSPSQSSYLSELQRSLRANLGWQRVLAYLRFLDGTLLLRLIEPLELRLKRKRGAPKLCLCDHALRAAWLREPIPLTPEGLGAAPHLHDLAGRIAESTVGYFFKSIYGLGVHHFPERAAEPEVDFILTVGEHRIPVEVKYRRRIDHADTRGLRAFMDKAHYHAPFSLLVTLEDAPGSDDPRIVSVPLSTLLLLR
ncbi:MAG: ATP-binding protein [Verrucomicrobia bacterium]|nr:ATP-binding protein [Verrucomicrobiota bacterium]